METWAVPLGIFVTTGVLSVVWAATRWTVAGAIRQEIAEPLGAMTSRVKDVEDSQARLSDEVHTLELDHAVTRGRLEDHTRVYEREVRDLREDFRRRVGIVLLALLVGMPTVAHTTRCDETIHETYDVRSGIVIPTDGQCGWGDALNNTIRGVGARAGFLDVASSWTTPQDYVSLSSTAVEPIFTLTDTSGSAVRLRASATELQVLSTEAQGWCQRNVFPAVRCTTSAECGTNGPCIGNTALRLTTSAADNTRGRLDLGFTNNQFLVGFGQPHSVAGAADVKSSYSTIRLDAGLGQLGLARIGVFGLDNDAAALFGVLGDAYNFETQNPMLGVYFNDSRTPTTPTVMLSNWNAGYTAGPVLSVRDSFHNINDPEIAPTVAITASGSCNITPGTYYASYSFENQLRRGKTRPSPVSSAVTVTAAGQRIDITVPGHCSATLERTCTIDGDCPGVETCKAPFDDTDVDRINVYIDSVNYRQLHNGQMTSASCSGKTCTYQLCGDLGGLKRCAFAPASLCVTDADCPRSSPCGQVKGYCNGDPSSTPCTTSAACSGGQTCQGVIREGVVPFTVNTTGYGIFDVSDSQDALDPARVIIRTDTATSQNFLHFQTSLGADVVKVTKAGEIALATGNGFTVQNAFTDAHPQVQAYIAGTGGEVDVRQIGANANPKATFGIDVFGNGALTFGTGAATPDARLRYVNPSTLQLDTNGLGTGSVVLALGAFNTTATSALRMYGYDGATAQNGQISYTGKSWTLGNYATQLETNGIATLAKAGIPVDGDFTDPINGMLAVDVNDSRLYARVGGSWVYASLLRLGDVPSTQTITAGGTIAADACGGIKRITAAGGVTTSTTNTFTAPATTNQGCQMVVCNTGANSITLDGNANFSTAAGDPGVALAGVDDCVIVVSDGLKWRQASAVLAGS